MKAARWRLILAAVLFFGWMGWLAFAVIQHRLAPPEIVSRAQLTEARVVVVAEVRSFNEPIVDVKTRIGSEGPESGALEIVNLSQARLPDGTASKPGLHLLLLVKLPVGNKYEIAGWPRSPGQLEVSPGQNAGEGKVVRPPVIYTWNDAVQRQLKALGYGW